MALPLAVGTAVYLLWRSPTLAVRWAGAADALAAVRAVASGVRPPGWVLFSLPDALWMYAFTACMALIWRERPGRQAAFWLAAAPLLGLGAELGQLAGIVPGTFDAADLWLGALASAIPLHLLYLRRCRAPSSPSWPSPFSSCSRRVPAPIPSPRTSSRR